MIIQLKNKIDAHDLATITNALKETGIKSNFVETQKNKYLVCFTKSEFDIRRFGHLSGVQDVHSVSDDYKLVSKKWKLNSSTIELIDQVSYTKEPIVMAGPCSVESEEQMEKIVSHLVKNNIKILRGGVFKPRSSPYAFRGLGIEGLKMMHSFCKPNDIKIVTEVMQVSQIDDMLPYVDVFQVGARNSQNFNLLDALGSINKPILLKRGISGTIDELLQSAEYIFSKGNEKIMLCERGIRTFENSYRNTFDINAIQVLKEKSHLPVIADPSHGVGIRDHVSKLALASLVAGADGVIYEVHPSPEEALSDGYQTLNFEESDNLIKQIGNLQVFLNSN
ncbi:MAG: bifunctional 3-deoxy-7-phosphoheptulonate synthase/chorismate mutase [Bacteroidia bacterium]|jgi:3-deoxy-7-phosphoheptulonate synthase|nr:bifunctional 3-deoxy-7-phosphoheptulonate synthase/chorismate mutase [Sphingobacteriaceae bacterium]MBP9068624.1 bifunctional 3-deoxy-7-phosphoheptulonate synthase/chorismate mutase [Bacteroidia bacterium]